MEVNHQFHQAGCPACVAVELATGPDRTRNQLDIVRLLGETARRVPGTPQSLPTLVNSGRPALIDVGTATAYLK